MWWRSGLNLKVRIHIIQSIICIIILGNNFNLHVSNERDRLQMDLIFQPYRNVCPWKTAALLIPRVWVWQRTRVDLSWTLPLNLSQLYSWSYSFHVCRLVANFEQINVSGPCGNVASLQKVQFGFTSNYALFRLRHSNIPSQNMCRWNPLAFN